MAPAGPSGELIRAHLDFLEQSGRSPRTMYQRNRSLIRLEAALGVPLIEATAAMLAVWRAGLTCGPEAICHYVGDARQFYAWAVDQELRADNPAAKLPVPGTGRMLPRPIGEEALFAALAAAPRRVRPWLVLAGWAGLRAKEIALLRRRDVLDTASPPVLIVARDATKGHRERIVQLSGFVIGELAACGLPASGWIFRRHDGRPGPNMPHLISKLANEHLHACGYGETLHQLRHRFGTMLYRQTHDLRLVQEQMGHASSKSTDGYTAYDQADAAAAVNLLPVPPRLKAVI